MKGDAWLARGALRESARAVLARAPDAGPRVRLLREVLRRTSGDRALDEARAALDASRHVRALATEQRRDGGFGRFHSRDSTLQQRIPTTEWGIERALALGLDAAHPTLVAVRGHLLKLLRGEIPFPDPAERNDRWEAGTRLFVASALSRLDPDAPALEPVRRLWVEIARRTLAAGRYDPEAEARAHAALTGASVRNSYLVLTNKYALFLLASRAGVLGRDIERTLVHTLWSSPRGIGYLGAPLGRAPPPRPASVDRWLASLDLALRFAAGRERAGPAFDWLRKRRAPNGAWDFGGPAPRGPALPLSESWRVLESRAIDWTVRVLTLAARA